MTCPQCGATEVPNGVVRCPECGSRFDGDETVIDLTDEVVVADDPTVDITDD